MPLRVKPLVWSENSDIDLFRTDQTVLGVFLVIYSPFENDWRLFRDNRSRFLGSFKTADSAKDEAFRVYSEMLLSAVEEVSDEAEAAC